AFTVGHIASLSKAEPTTLSLDGQLPHLHGRMGTSSTAHEEGGSRLPDEVMNVTNSACRCRGSHPRPSCRPRGSPGRTAPRAGNGTPASEPVQQSDDVLS